MPVFSVRSFFSAPTTSILTLILLCALACSSAATERELLDSLLKRKIACPFNGTFQSMGQIRTIAVGNAAYAFNYWYPYNFKEKKVVINSNQPNDTSTYISPHNKCTLKIWPGKIVNFPLGTVDSLGKRIPLRAEDIIRAEQQVDQYIALIKSGKEVHTAQVQVLELCKGVDGYNFQIHLKGKLSSKDVIYKIELSELPVSGDLIFKHMLFSFDSGYAKKYEAVGIAIARDFGMW